MMTVMMAPAPPRPNKMSPPNRPLIPHRDETTGGGGVKGDESRLGLKYAFSFFHELNLDADRAVWHLTQQVNGACKPPPTAPHYVILLFSSFGVSSLTGC